MQAGQGAVAAWLFACCALVFAMVVVGGITRLTHSGLSIVEWQPIVGTLPPLGEAQWLETFEKYKATPEYKQVNQGMSLGEFKGIFWWEYIHRLLGRLIGLAFLLPLAWFWMRGRIRGALRLELLGIFLLGGLQGALGWYMVQSGLVDNPRVSQYRLTAHLALALAIYAAMFWSALSLLERRPRPAAHRVLQRLGWTVTAVVAYMVITGGFVAGIRAGYAYNTFPLMNGHWVPPEIMQIEPWYLNFFNNMATVQFDHRAGAWALALLVPWLWLRARREALGAEGRRAAHLLLAAAILQIGLGIATLLLAVPVALGAAHQGGAVLLLSAALYVNRQLRATAPAAAGMR
jgi:cytochrome c oxidase assembly protein subunit 15